MTTGQTTPPDAPVPGNEDAYDRLPAPPARIWQVGAEPRSFTVPADPSSSSIDPEPRTIL